MQIHKRVRFGVNYTPSKDWYYFWENGKSADSISDDFDAISSEGLDHIRLQLRWDVFQQDTALFSAQAFTKLEKVLDCAYKYNLDVELCLFTGWLSGFWFLPGFLKGRHILRDRSAIEAECSFLQELADRFGSHKALEGIDLGNEINMFASIPGMDFTREEGDKWLAEISAFAQKMFAGKSVVLGVDHQPYFSDVYFSRQRLNECGTATTLHTWTKFTGALADGGILGAKSRRLAQICAELAAAYIKNDAREIRIQEFGVSEEWAPKGELAPFIEDTVENALSCEKVSRFTYWCSHDIDKRYGGFDKLEYDLGLFDSKNHLKEQGKAFTRLISDVQNRKETMPKTAIVVREGTDTKGKPFGWYYGDAFTLLAESGKPAAFILAENIGDTAEFARRNITHTVEADEVL